MPTPKNPGGRPKGPPKKPITVRLPINLVDQLKRTGHPSKAVEMAMTANNEADRRVGDNTETKKGD